MQKKEKKITGQIAYWLVLSTCKLEVMGLNLVRVEKIFRS